MKVKTSIKGGGINENHNETIVRDASKTRVPKGNARGLKVKTSVKAGVLCNHNEVLLRDASKAKAPTGKIPGLLVRTSLKAGAIAATKGAGIRTL